MINSFWRCSVCDSGAYARSIRDSDRCIRCVKEGRTEPPPTETEPPTYPCEDCGTDLTTITLGRLRFCPECRERRDRMSEVRRRLRRNAKLRQARLQEVQREG